MKHLVDLDDDLLEQARASLGTVTIKDTVNEALRRVSQKGREELNQAINELARLGTELPISDRSDAW